MKQILIITFSLLLGGVVYAAENCQVVGSRGKVTGAFCHSLIETVEVAKQRCGCKNLDKYIHSKADEKNSEDTAVVDEDDSSSEDSSGEESSFSYELLKDKDCAPRGLIHAPRDTHQCAIKTDCGLLIVGTHDLTQFKEGGSFQNCLMRKITCRPICKK